MLLSINTQKTKLQRGFMMTEVLITALLIVIAMVGILPILFSGVKSSKVSKTRSLMTNIAQKEIETFNQRKFDASLNFMVEKIGYIDENDKKVLLNNIITNGRTFTDIEELCLNTTNGEIKPPVNGACPDKKVILTKTYKYAQGEETRTDDFINYTINVKINGSTSNPVILQATLSRDKIF